MRAIAGAWWGAVLVFVFVLGTVFGAVVVDALAGIGESSARSIEATSEVVEVMVGGSDG